MVRTGVMRVGRLLELCASLKPRPVRLRLLPAPFYASLQPGLHARHIGARSASSKAGAEAANYNLELPEEASLIRRSQEERSATRALNGKLSVLLNEQADLRDARRAVRAAGAVMFDRWTLDFLLRIARNAPEKDASAFQRYRFALRMLQRARADRARLNSYTLAQFLPLAKGRLKVNSVLAVKNLIQAQGSVLDDFAYKGLIRHFSYCNRPQLVRLMFEEQVRVHGTADTETFTAVLLAFLKHRDGEKAYEIWKLLHEPRFAQRVVIDGELLACGVSVCFWRDDLVDEARYIVSKYRQLSIIPRSTDLHALTSVYINGGDFAEACATMHWIIELGYTLHEGKIFHYLPHCSRRLKADQLLPLADVLAHPALHLATDAHERMRVLRAYLSALGASVNDGRLEVDAAADAARRLVTRYRIKDSRLLAYVYYLTGEQLDGNKGAGTLFVGENGTKEEPARPDPGPKREQIQWTNGRGAEQLRKWMQGQV
ncbi:hypothetical protein FVE85_8904 [Porphyridium purpureum]|uniref:Pentatricopeptide repeat-containing protein n=1 Tax=Porphyridium purpureum TaxID=35688 RepID=A0A5J4YPS9_PORPP|nr:hypothetical protein FVE85_8904 [Porphyridium purpureum]|eukprot:POR2948..scf296_7